MESETVQALVFGTISSFLAIFFGLLAFFSEIYILWGVSSFFVIITFRILFELRKKPEYPEWPEPPKHKP